MMKTPSTFCPQPACGPQVTKEPDSEKTANQVLVFSVVAPAGTPPVVVEKLNKAIRQALTRPGVKAAFATSTTELVPVATAELTQLLNTETPQWHALIKAAGIEPQ